ncbi:TolC family protein [Sphingomonas sp. NCPPB 2930]
MALLVVSCSAHAQLPPAAVSTPGTLAAPSAANPLSMGDAVRRALAANPDLSAVRREWEATAGALTQAGLRPNPEAGFVQEDIRNGRRTSTLQVTVPIERGGKRDARIAVASRVRQQAESGVEQYRADVRAAVITHYFGVLLAKERLKLAQESLVLSSDSADAAGKRVQAGKVSPVEETRARVAQAAAQAELARAESDVRVARQRLSSLWGDTVSTYGDLAGALVLPAEGLPDEFVHQRLQASPPLRRARLEVERWRASVNLEKARSVVDVAVTAGAKRDQASGTTMAVVGLSVPIPLFDRNQGNIAEAVSREYKAQDELAAAEVRLASQVSQAREQLRAARTEALTLQRDAVPGARSAYQAASQGFTLGKFSYLEALDAQRTLIGTQAQYLRALSDTYQAAAELERLLGISDDTSVLLNPP